MLVIQVSETACSALSTVSLAASMVGSAAMAAEASDMLSTAAVRVVAAKRLIGCFRIRLLYIPDNLQTNSWLQVQQYCCRGYASF